MVRVGREGRGFAVSELIVMCFLFLGFNCEINLDDCVSNFCDSGICLDKIDGYECVCESGYIGERF